MTEEQPTHVETSTPAQDTEPQQQTNTQEPQQESSNVAHTESTTNESETAKVAHDEPVVQSTPVESEPAPPQPVEAEPVVTESKPIEEAPVATSTETAPVEVEHPREEPQPTPAVEPAAAVVVPAPVEPASIPVEPQVAAPVPVVSESEPKSALAEPDATPSASEPTVVPPVTPQVSEQPQSTQASESVAPAPAHTEPQVSEQPQSTPVSEPVTVVPTPAPVPVETSQAPVQAAEPTPTSTSSSSSAAPAVAPSASSSHSQPAQIYITPDADRPILMAESGFGSNAPVTTMQVFKETATKNIDKIALSVKRDQTWKHWSWGDYYNQSVQFARALIHLKFQPTQTVSILGFNSPEWFISNMGAIAAGGLAAGIYTTNGPDACAYIVDHSKSAVVVVENESQLKKILQVKDKLPSVQAIVQWSGVVPTDMPNLVYAWDAFLALGENVPVAEVDARVADLKPSRACTLIYTSGTTGPPKAVMLSHDNLTFTASSAASVIKGGSNETVLSYLPLSHVAAQLVDIHGAIYLGAHVWFAQPDALKGSLGATLKEVRPTIFFGVPRVWEKVQEKMVEAAKNNSGTKKKIAVWARGVGMKAREHKQGMPWGWTIARKLVFDKVKGLLGLDRARFLATAAAPMPEETADFFMSLNIPICDVYGMSEVSGPSTVTPPDVLRSGSIGLPIPGMQLKIDNPDEKGNGEICWRGRSTFLGYMHNEKETRETFDNEGWLHTGDIGRLDADGYLFITGRIKELIITAGGENVPPVLIEDELKAEMGGVISNLMAVGDKRKFLACLITLKTEPIPEPVEGQYPLTNNLTKEAVRVLQGLGSQAKTVEEAKQDAVLKKWITDALARYNKRATSGAQQIRAFCILDQDFVLENETVTPTMKLKRRIVLQKFSKEIDEMYAAAEREFAAS